ncbi:hypothetical protein VNI00_000712 [Paramarasmius palmivorus]|uniref:Uncharacterized protein n=1 Tax=Paramarasmius palmivorus TaxID=297713 RepID=A0AAW0E9E8_9AGAR
MSSWLQAFLGLVWPLFAKIDAAEHAESIKAQFRDKMAQNRENPYYSIFSSWMIPFLNALYSTGDLHLEGAPLPELYYTTSVTAEESARLRDPDYVVEFDAPMKDEWEQRSPGEEAEGEPEVTDAIITVDTGLDGTKWELKTSRETRQVMMRRQELSYADIIRPASQRPSATSATHHTASASTSTISSTSSGSSQAEQLVTVIRAADGMIVARPKLSRYRQIYPNADYAPATPIFSYEVKVPREFSAGDDVSIQQSQALSVVVEALPQIVQHVQFIFHQYPRLNALWAAGICGKWIQFYRFTRASTPAIDKMEVLNKHTYFTGNAQTVPRQMSPMISIIDDDGFYTKEFKDCWSKVMATADEVHRELYPQKASE